MRPHVSWPAPARALLVLTALVFSVAGGAPSTTPSATAAPTVLVATALASTPGSGVDDSAVAAPANVAFRPSSAAAAQRTSSPIHPVAKCGGDTYRNSDGDCVPVPEHAATPPAGASAQCQDGTYSYSKHRRGTCSNHGGVARWL
ncbi:DUF3761 domain-containing protein [Nocardia sp. NPDC019255]|uniref:DUF3761 domain-containing protein n=1 Tax=Nocardia sp. NPDC019255 TaxID=3154591 RepID=UPI003404E0EA